MADETKTDETDPVTGIPVSEGDGTSKPKSEFDDETEGDPAIDGVQALSDDDEVAERSPDGDDPGTFRKAFILERLDLTADGKVPDGFDHAPNIDGVRAFGVQAGVRFTGPIKLISNRKSPTTQGARVLVYGGPAVPAGTLDDDGNPVRDYYDPKVVDAGEPDEHTESGSEQSQDATTDGAKSGEGAGTDEGNKTDAK